MSTPARPAPKKRKHLIDFDNPPVVSREAEARLTRVQQWVMSALLVTTALHLAAGLVVAAVAIDGHLDARVGLMVIAGLVGLLGMGIGLAIHQRSPLHPLLLLGLLPALAGIPWVF